MIEDEAKTKWCPFAREASTPGGWNRGVFSDGPRSKCLGSQCMAWRATDREAVPCQPDGEPDFKEAGYCGLAGKP